MKYLAMVKNDRAMPAIIQEAIENGFRVLSSDGECVTVKSGCPPVEISYGMCLCHGGRMRPSQKNTGIRIELSPDTYDEDRGIVDAETEPAWRIENEMADTVKSFERYVFGEPGRDINSEYGTVLRKCPNPDICYEHAYDGEDDGRIKFIGRCFRRGNGEFKKDREWNIEYRVFRKGRG